MEIISKKNKNITVYKIIYLGLIYKVITEKEYLIYLIRLYANGFKTYHLNNFNLLALNMRDRYTNACNVSLLLHQHNILHKNIFKIKQFFPDIICEKDIDLKRFVRQLKEKKKIIRSFSKFEVLNPINLSPISIASFEASQIDELVNRLHHFVHVFGITRLKKMGVRLIPASDVFQMNHQTLRLYYNDCMESVFQCIVKYIGFCKTLQSVIICLEKIVKTIRPISLYDMDQKQLIVS